MVRPYVTAAAALALALAIGSAVLPGHASGDEGPAQQLIGTWKRLPLPPDVHGLDVGDAVLMDDGSIVVTYVRRMDVDVGPCIAVYSPDTGIWSQPALAGDGLPSGQCFHDFEQFVLGPDGRLYSESHTVDPTTSPWLVEYSDRWMLAADDVTLTNMGISTNGLAYLQSTRGRSSSTVLVEVDLITDAIRETAPVDGINHWVIAGPTDRLYVMDNQGVIRSYNPVDDTWRTESSVAPGFPYRDTVAFGPDGRIYVQEAEGGWPDFSADLMAWDPDRSTWARLQPPADLDPEQFWYPMPVAGPDGLLYALDVRQPYSFAPRGLMAAPGQIPDGALPAAGGSERLTLLGLLLLLLGTLPLMHRLVMTPRPVQRMLRRPPLTPPSRFGQ